MFTGRRLDILDSGSLKIQYNRNRYYDPYSGRWLTHDPLGITPNPQPPNIFDTTSQYKDSLSLYQYVTSNPVMNMDSMGLVLVPIRPKCCKIKETETFPYVGIPGESYTMSTCTQNTIYSDCSPEAACCAAYGDNDNIEVYEAEEGPCCWCNVYVQRLPFTYAGMTFYAHQEINVKCDPPGNSWAADIGPERSPTQPHMVDVRVTRYSEGGDFIMRVSCEVADSTESELRGSRALYWFPVHHCGHFVSDTIWQMRAKCP